MSFSLFFYAHKFCWFLCLSYFLFTHFFAITPFPEPYISSHSPPCSFFLHTRHPRFLTILLDVSAINLHPTHNNKG
ncbi:hypothetical protein K457DRAFT_170097 [Linnemannia elongata AG-77]|uniref:Uncharacterized protein n=1 Tax=Linnemannia elongata AG-77 TaxID=1314771 RepID=A0A197KFQ4_9FUNG|nr:hypothetical protein K457DRAFT_170097 [Linnemannia elongata AG-77]